MELLFVREVGDIAHISLRRLGVPDFHIIMEETLKVLQETSDRLKELAADMERKGTGGAPER